jgi:hypothetical protein
MRKIFASLCLLLPLLAGCNFPLQANNTPTVDVLETRVVASLTQAPAAASATPQPTSPPSPTLKPATPLPSASPTHVPTATVMPSPTTSSSDPKASLGKATWTGSFDNAKNWGLETPYDDGHTRVEINNGAMVLTSQKAEGWLGWWQVSNQKPQNFYLEATIQVNECSGNDLYGLIFRSPDNSGGYWYGVTCDGQYNLKVGDGGSLSVLVKTVKDDGILSGANQTNRLGVMVKDNKISLYINGKLLGDTTDNTYTDAGTFGLFITGQKTINFSFACTAIEYWTLS